MRPLARREGVGRVAGACVVLVVLGSLGACAGPGDSGDRAGVGDGGGGPTLRVLAASSLTEAFTASAAAFEGEHQRDAVDVVLSFGASSAIARHIVDGAPADVVVTADERTMRQIVDADAAVNPVVVARNRLTILVETGNPKDITGLGDLARSDLLVVLCAPEVPCGALAERAMTQAGARVRPASLEENVKGVVAKVSLGEADAGIVYETDARAASSGGRTSSVPIDAALAADADVEAVYSAAITTGASDAGLARAWITFLQSAAGRRQLARFGFRLP